MTLVKRSTVKPVHVQLLQLPSVKVFPYTGGVYIVAKVFSLPYQHTLLFADPPPVFVVSVVLRRDHTLARGAYDRSKFVYRSESEIYVCPA